MYLHIYMYEYIYIYIHIRMYMCVPLQEKSMKSMRRLLREAGEQLAQFKWPIVAPKTSIFKTVSSRAWRQF